MLLHVNHYVCTVRDGWIRVIASSLDTALENVWKQTRSVERLVLFAESVQVPSVRGHRTRHQVGQGHKQNEYPVGTGRHEREPKPRPQLRRVLRARGELEHAPPAASD